MAAAATAMHSTALAGQSLRKPVNDLGRKVGTNEARVTMRKTSKSSDSIGCGADRPKDLGPCSENTPSYLTDEFARDYEYDTVGLCPERETFPCAISSELQVIHARWAMLVALGIVTPERLAKSGMKWGDAAWVKAGSQISVSGEFIHLG